MNPTPPEITSFHTKDIRIDCKIHGTVSVQSAWDPFLKKMSGISCAKCPTITQELYEYLTLQKQQLLDAVEKAGPEDKESKSIATKLVRAFEAVVHRGRMDADVMQKYQDADRKASEVVGFNKANEAWRTAINKLREGLGEV